jgi:hypothetical protein
MRFGTGVAFISGGGVNIRGQPPMVLAFSSIGEIAMKKTLLVLSLFILSLFMTTAAFAQNVGGGYISAQPQIYHAPDHPEHAAFAPMATEQNVYPGNSYTFGEGDRPASDFPHAASPSLGDIARELKKEHALVRKSDTVWVNQ